MTQSEIDELVYWLRDEYPDARYELDWSSPFELLVATILAAQSSDARVNKVTPELFARFPDARAMADANRQELEQLIRPAGFFRQKAKTIQGVCRRLLDDFGGAVPRTIEELVTLPGVARKSANVVLNTAWNIPSGIIVDLHVLRVAPRLGLTAAARPEKMERALMELIPQQEWTFFGPALILHGRYTCKAKKPACDGCVLEELCEKNLEDGIKAGSGRSSRPSTRRIQPPQPRFTEDDEPMSNRDDLGLTPDYPTSTGGDSLAAQIPASWQGVLADELHKPYMGELEAFVAEQRRTHTVFPPADQVFSALELTPYDDVGVLVLGQDPYHDHDQAHGLCFSVQPGVKIPPSLRNIYKELKDDVGFRIPNHGYLVDWAEQGMLMLNAVLTVQAHKANSHKNRGWETFTDAVIRAVSAKRDRVVFVLWGGYAKKKHKLIDTKRHTVITGAHPSPLSAHAGFFGSRPFSAINEALYDAGKAEIDWQLRDQ